MGMELTVEGIPEIEAALKGLPIAVRYIALDKAIRPAMELVKSAIVARAKFGPYSRGMRGLAGSIKAEVFAYSGGPAGVVRPNRKRGGGGAHAHLVEFGTMPHAGKYYGRRSQHPGTNPQPFFGPGVDASEAAAVDLMHKACGDAAKAYWDSQGGASA